MTPFFVLFACLALFAFADAANVRRNQKGLLLAIATTVLVLFAGLRYGDPDYLPYQMIFEQARQWDFEASPDIGYTLFNALLGLVCNDPLIVFITVAAISVSLNVKCFAEYGRYALIAILFYFVHNYALKEMIQIRAGLACAIGFYNVRNMHKGRYARFWCIQVLATSIHLGAIMFALGWLIKQCAFSKRVWAYIISVCFVIGIACPFGVILKSLPGMGLLERIQTYSEWGDYAESIGVLSNMATLKQLSVCGLIIGFYDRFKENIKYFDILAAMYFASTCWLMVWNDFAIVGARMATFLSVGEPVIIGSIPLLATPKSRFLVLLLLVAAALVFLLTNMQGKIQPYQFYPAL